MGQWLHAPALLQDLEAMGNKGHRVVGLFPVIRETKSVDHDNFTIEGIRLKHLLPLLSDFQFCIIAIARFIKKHRDAQAIILAADEYPLTPVWLLRRLFSNNVPPLLAIRDFSPIVESHGVRRFYRILLRYVSLGLLSSYADVIFAISPMHAQEIASKYSIPSNRVRVWPSSVDTELFDPAKYNDDRHRIRRELRVENRFLVMHHGVLTMERGLPELFEAMRIVQKVRSDIALLLLGTGEARRQLEELADSSGLGETVIFHDPVSHQDVPRFIAAADAGVSPLPDQPRWRVQTPTKMLEYLMMRKPVIVTDIPANRWIVENQPVAFFCGRGNSEDIAKAILECAQTRSGISESERNEIATRFSSQSVADRVLSIIGEVHRR